MPTDKRARQRAARMEKQAALERRQKRRKTIRRVVSVVVLAAVVILIVVLVSHSPKKAPLKAAGPTTSSTTTTTLPAPTCPPAAGTTQKIQTFAKAPPDCIPATSVWDITMKTSLGTIKVTMDAAKSYAAVNNFVFLTEYHYYDGTFFHRVIPGFVIQGGDPTGTGTGGPNHDPGYSFTGNFPPASCATKATSACYQPGDFVMANSNSNPKVQNASTDGSQFFIVLPGGQTQLNSEPTYTLFGKVTSGMTVVDKIGADGSSAGTPKVKVYVTSVTAKQVKS